MVQQNYNTFKSVSIAGFLDISILVKSIFLYSIMDTKFYIKHDCQLFSSNTRREEAKSYERFIKKKIRILYWSFDRNFGASLH